MANLALPNAVDTTEPLLDPVGVPWKVIVDQQVCVLKVDALPRCIGGNEEDTPVVGLERLLDLAAVLMTNSTVNGDNSVVTAQMVPQAGHQVIQSVTVLAEDDHLAAGTGSVSHLVSVIEGLLESVPFGVRRGVPDRPCLFHQPRQRCDLGFHLAHGRGGCCSRDGLVFQRLTLLVGQVIKVDVIIERREVDSSWSADP